MAIFSPELTCTWLKKLVLFGRNNTELDLMRPMAEITLENLYKLVENMADYLMTKVATKEELNRLSERVAQLCERIDQHTERVDK